jgi:DNA-binding winged helix-turn-helix (wHTH) protein
MFQFQGYTLDIARHTLRAADREVALRPKSFQLLRYLVENPDRLVTTEVLLRAIGPNVVVTNESLTHCVREVRQAIGDSKQTIIVTVLRRGYRFTAPVSRVATGAAGATQPTPPTAVSPPVSSDSGPRSQSSLDRPSVAVLPFANLSGDPQQDYFSDGITEDIITELSRFSELLVIARNSSFQYKSKAIDVRRVRRGLGARHVLEGSVREQSLAIDPNYSRAAAMWTHFYGYIMPLDGDYLSPPALDRALELAQTAVHLDPRLPQARAALGHVLLFKRQHDAAILEFERAFALNPNFIDYRYALALVYVGEPARAIEVLEAIIRLDPFPPSMTFGQMGFANYMRKRYGDAMHWCGEHI